MVAQQQTTAEASRQTPPETLSETGRVVTETNSGHELIVVDTVRAMRPRQWNAVVDRSRCGTVFHRYEWLEAIETGLSYPATHLVVRKDGNPIALWPNFVVDLPPTRVRRLTSLYPGFGGPVVTTDVSEVLPLLVDGIPDCCSGRTVVHEIRACNPDYLRYNDVLQSRGYRPARFGGRFQLDLEGGYDDVLSGMSNTRRKGIRRGRNTDHELVEEDVTRETLARFHRVYEQQMASTDGEAYPVAFFEQLAEMHSRILLVTLRVEGEYAGGFLELLDEEQSTVHGFFAAVPDQYYEYHASELLYDFVIRWAIDNGYETYDFGGSEADFRNGVFRFKEGFGGELVPNIYWERGCSTLWPLVRAGRSLYWRRRK